MIGMDPPSDRVRVRDKGSGAVAGADRLAAVNRPFGSRQNTAVGLLGPSQILAVAGCLPNVRTRGGALSVAYEIARGQRIV